MKSNMNNYIIYTDGFDGLCDVMFKDIEKQSNVRIIHKNMCFKSRVIQKIFRVHFSFKINNMINLPAKRIWFPFLDREFGNNNCTIYVFMSSWYHPELISYFKKKHPSCKIAFYFGDTIVSKQRVIKRLDINILKEKCDVVCSYNPADVKEYKIKYLQMCYSKISETRFRAHKEHYNILFIGASRNRMTYIKNCYEKVKKTNISYFFYVVDHEGNGTDNIDENFIITNEVMNYYDYLGYVINADCLIEIVDSESEGGTLRFWDAVMYNKKLVTNNKQALQSKYYDGRNIIFSVDFADIDYNALIKNPKPDFFYDGENSPRFFLNSISKMVEG